MRPATAAPCGQVEQKCIPASGSRCDRLVLPAAFPVPEGWYHVTTQRQYEANPISKVGKGYGNMAMYTVWLVEYTVQQILCTLRVSA